MTLVIPHALPPSINAQALIEPFASRFPKLVHLFNAKQAQTEAWLAAEHGCTPAQGLKLRDLGFEAPPGTTIGSGLGPWHAAEAQSNEQAWVAELCATVLSQERASVLPLELIDVAPNDIVALEQVVEPLFDDAGDGIRIERLGQGIWRVHGSFPEDARTISPLALAGQDLGDWWPTDLAWRNWRKRVNEIQMAWHDHPVNQAREQRGLPPINSVWLYGGARGFEPKKTSDSKWLESLTLPANRGDWSTWLELWSEIEPVMLGASPDTEIILTGDDRIVRLSNAPKRWWQNLFAKEQPNSWRTWWLNQN